MNEQRLHSQVGIYTIKSTSSLTLMIFIQQHAAYYKNYPNSKVPIKCNVLFSNQLIFSM